MFRNFVVRAAAVLSLALVLAGPVQAAGPESSPSGLQSALTQVWDWLSGLWSGSDGGCGIDPDGRPRCAPDAEAETDSDAGCDIDPNGKPRCAQ